MGDKAISTHGTLIARQPSGVGGFTTIGELRDITPPPLTRNSFETTAHNDLEESFIAGMRRKGELQFQVNWAPVGEATHGAVSGLLKSWQDGSRDGWRITFPDGSTWTFLGYVTQIAPADPVEDAQVADITIRPTGTMTIA